MAILRIKEDMLLLQRQTFFLYFLSVSYTHLDVYKRQELGHIILHRSQLKMAPMQDDTLYNMTDNTEYQANLFAADLLIEDEDIEEMVQNEDLDYFGLCSSLNATPELMSFKLYSLAKRGQAYHMPMEIQSNFLAK